MQPGFQFEYEEQGLRIRVIYSQHFANRYLEAREGKPAPSAVVSEQDIALKIREALPQIAAITDTQSAFEGVIQSRRKRLIMVFAVKESQKAPTVVMKSIMIKSDYHTKGLSDYIIPVNPPATILFRKGIGASLREAVLADLVSQLSEFEDDNAYHMGGEIVEYWVERQGEHYYVDDADWKYDLYEVQVS